MVVIIMGVWVWSSHAGRLNLRRGHLHPEHGPFWVSPSGGLSTEIKFNISLEKKIILAWFPQQQLPLYSADTEKLSNGKF